MESVDRNTLAVERAYVKQVALRMESVDRNISPGNNGVPDRLSLSAWRAWIEIARRNTANG